MSLLTACSVALCMTTGVMADPTVYDATMTSGQGFSVGEDTTATRIYPGEKGLWIGTDNGLSFFSETIRPVNKIDFSNNIYDILSEARAICDYNHTDG